VIVLPDNDRPGEKHAAQVARSCRAAGLRVGVLKLPDLPPKGDVIDWRARGHTREELDGLVAELRLGAVPSPSEGPSERPPGPLGPFGGDPGLGKSFITLDVAARLSTAAAWPDGSAPGAEPVHTVIFSAEDGAADTIVRRLEQQGANLDRIHIVTATRGAEGERVFSLARTCQPSSTPCARRALAASSWTR
jgi:putative DNA primase/helicase